MTKATTLTAIAQEDIGEILRKNAEYGESWKQRGGIGAFMMLARKWDRLEPQVKRHGYDIFSAITADQRPEGVLDDIRDLRRYLMLVESEVREGLLREPLSGASTDAASAAEFSRQATAHGAVAAPPIGFGGASGGPTRVGLPFTATASPGASQAGPRLPDPAPGMSAQHRKVPVRDAAAESAKHRKVPESVTLPGSLSPAQLAEIKRQIETNPSILQVGLHPDNTPVMADYTGMQGPFGYDARDED